MKRGKRQEMKEISKAEEMVLLAIWRLENDAYGVSIRRQIHKDTGKDYTYGTLYGLLRQMGRKGERSKTYFMLTPSGIRALKDAIALHKRMWQDINEFSLD